ncbi:MAG: hypothetical protein MUC36_11570 [Planctomycetes bacterium]|jgi:hypothetical protein|nr:hypothetical protein [Planctomycetota bacterium]
MQATVDKKLIRSISDAPILGHLSRLCARGGDWAPFVVLLLLVQWDLLPLWAIASVLVAALVLRIWNHVCYPGHRHFAGTITHLHGRLHWFDADTITWFRKDQLAELRARLTERDVVVHELDGTTISSLAALVTELHHRFGKRAGPKDPAANAAAILVEMAIRQGGTHALLWHDFGNFARRDPEGFGRFMARWTSTVALSMPHVLLFVERPLPPAAESPVDHAEPAAAATATADAWWERRPGELVD